MPRTETSLLENLDSPSDESYLVFSGRLQSITGQCQVLQDYNTVQKRDIVELPIEVDPFSKGYHGTAISVSVPMPPLTPAADRKSVQFSPDCVDLNPDKTQSILDHQRTNDNTLIRANCSSTPAPRSNSTNLKMKSFLNGYEHIFDLEDEQTDALGSSVPVKEEVKDLFISGHKHQLKDCFVPVEDKSGLIRKVFEFPSEAESTTTEKPNTHLKGTEEAQIHSSVSSADSVILENLSVCHDVFNDSATCHDVKNEIENSMEPCDYNLIRVPLPDYPNSTTSEEPLSSPKAKSLLLKKTQEVTQLQSELQQRDAEISELKEQVASLLSSKDDATAQNELIRTDLKLTVASLKQEVENCDRKQNELKREIQNFHSSFNDQNAIILSLEQEKLQMYTDNCLLKLQVTRQSRERVTLQNEIESLNIKVASLQVEGQVAAETNKLSEEKVLELAQLDKSQATVIVQLKEEVEALQTTSKACAETKQVLSLQVSSLKIEEKHLKLRITIIEKENGDLRKFLSDTQSNLKIAQDRTFRSKLKIELLTQKISDLENDKDELQRRMTEEHKELVKASSEKIQGMNEEIMRLNAKILELECAYENANAAKADVSASLTKTKEEKHAIKLKVSNTLDSFQRLEKNMMSLQEAYDTKVQKTQQLTVEKRDLMESLESIKDCLHTKENECLQLREIMQRKEDEWRQVKNEANTRVKDLEKQQERAQTIQFSLESKLQANFDNTADLMAREMELARQLKVAETACRESQEHCQQLQERISHNDSLLTEFSALKKRFEASLLQRGVILQAICSKLQQCAPAEYKELFQVTLEYPLNRQMSDRRVNRLASYIKNTLKFMQEQSELQARRVVVLEEENRELLRNLIQRAHFTNSKKPKSSKSPKPSESGEENTMNCG